MQIQIHNWKIKGWLPPHWWPWGNAHCQSGYFTCFLRWSYFRICGFSFDCEPEPSDAKGWQDWFKKYAK